MSTPALHPPALVAAIPAHATARLVSNLNAFVGSVEKALSSGEADPRQHARWSRALPLLQRDRKAVAAAAQLAAEGRFEPLLAHASRLRFLARHMDGYRLDFAGAALAQRLETERRLLVLIAWQIVAVASGSGASGL